MISIKLNGKKLQISCDLTLKELLYKHIDTEVSCAVSLNFCFISKIKYASTILKNDDVIDIIQPMQGG